MARQTRSAESRAQTGRMALALGFMVRDPLRAARILESHAPEHSAELLTGLKTRNAAAVLAKMTPRHAARHLSALSPDEAARILKELAAVDVAAILRCADGRRREAVLRRLSRRQSVSLNWLLSHPETSVGAWTDASVLALAADITAQEAVRQIQRAESTSGEWVYVISRSRRLRGMVSTTALLRATADKPLATLLERVPATLQAQSSLVSASTLQAWQTQHTLPVLDRLQNFVGVLQRAELDRALALDSAGSTSVNISDTLLEASEAYWSGLSALIKASFSLLTSPPKIQQNAKEREP